MLHTWSGLLLGWILFGVFLAGTVSFWRDEISRWARPELSPAIDRVAVLDGAIGFLRGKAPDASSWTIELPNDRSAGTLVRWQPQPKKGGKARAERGFHNMQWLDGSGRPVHVRETRGGDFFYRLHFDLHYMPVTWGRWLVGVAAMMMLVAIVSGVITHKRIFRDFFTFRPGRRQRSWLDGHNATAVLALPFHLMITYTGLITLMNIYMPWAAIANYGGLKPMYRDLLTSEIKAERVEQAAPLPPLALIVADAERRWHGGHAASVRVLQPGDAGQRVVVSRRLSDRLVDGGDPVRFNGAGQHLSGPSAESATLAARGAMIGLHAGRFADLAMRWLYFLCSTAGTLMVATGLVLWTTKRREKFADATRPPFGFRVVERLNLAFIAGMPLAMTGFLWANRLLPVAMRGRADAEIAAMFQLWGVAIIVALLARPRYAWGGLFLATAVSLVGLVVADLFVTDTGLAASFVRGDWPMAAMEIAFLCLAAGFGWFAWRYWQQPTAPRPALRRTIAPRPAA
ncbi:PepSY-associated TM helix domain-containing protein [Sphingomonas sp. PsM26]|nr:PepSY-associated TM helix domain-containing protein [Sphingomonas sp. PsM26]